MTTIAGNEPPAIRSRRRLWGWAFGVLYAVVLLAALLPIHVENPIDRTTVGCGTGLRSAMYDGDSLCGEKGRKRVATAGGFLLVSLPFAVAYVAACARERRD
jgi:hypothetical protein